MRHVLSLKKKDNTHKPLTINVQFRTRYERHFNLKSRHSSMAGCTECTLKKQYMIFFLIKIAQSSSTRKSGPDTSVVEVTCEIYTQKAQKFCAEM